MFMISWLFTIFLTKNTFCTQQIKGGHSPFCLLFLPVVYLSINSCTQLTTFLHHCLPGSRFEAFKSGDCFLYVLIECVLSEVLTLLSPVQTSPVFCRGFPSSLGSVAQDRGVHWLWWVAYYGLKMENVNTLQGFLMRNIFLHLCELCFLFSFTLMENFYFTSCRVRPDR